MSSAIVHSAKQDSQPWLLAYGTSNRSHHGSRTQRKIFTCPTVYPLMAPDNVVYHLAVDAEKMKQLVTKFFEDKQVGAVKLTHSDEMPLPCLKKIQEFIEDKQIANLVIHVSNSSDSEESSSRDLNTAEVKEYSTLLESKALTTLVLPYAFAKALVNSKVLMDQDNHEKLLEDATDVAKTIFNNYPNLQQVMIRVAICGLSLSATRSVQANSNPPASTSSSARITRISEKQLKLSPSRSTESVQSVPSRNSFERRTGATSGDISAPVKVPRSPTNPQKPTVGESTNSGQNLQLQTSPERLSADVVGEPSPSRRRRRKLAADTHIEKPEIQVKVEEFSKKEKASEGRALTRLAEYLAQGKPLEQARISLSNCEMSSDSFSASVKVKTPESVLWKEWWKSMAIPTDKVDPSLKTRKEESAQRWFSLVETDYEKMLDHPVIRAMRGSTVSPILMRIYFAQQVLFYQSYRPIQASLVAKGQMIGQYEAEFGEFVTGSILPGAFATVSEGHTLSNQLYQSYGGSLANVNKLKTRALTRYIHFFQGISNETPAGAFGRLYYCLLSFYRISKVLKAEGHAKSINSFVEYNVREKRANMLDWYNLIFCMLHARGEMRAGETALKDAAQYELELLNDIYDSWQEEEKRIRAQSRPSARGKAGENSEFSSFGTESSDEEEASYK